MKKLLLVALVMLAIGSRAFAQNYPMKTLLQIQTINKDSLAKADQLGIGSPQWRLQTSPLKDSLVTVVALVTVPPHYITYTATGKTMCLVDTGANGYKPFSGILVRYGGWDGSFDENGYNSIQRGDIIKIRGKITEFPTSNMNSLTQFEPDTMYQISILSSNNPLPPPAKLQISDFNQGVNPNGHVNIITGEQYESKEVLFTNLTVVGNVNATRGTFSVADAQGNQLSDYDWSYYYTIGHGSIIVPGDPNYVVPIAGAHIDTLRGYISTSSGSEASRGYRICPIFPGDIVYGGVAPAVQSHRRYPVMVTPDSTPQISARVFRQSFGKVIGDPLTTISLLYSINDGAWQTVVMTAPQAAKDSLYYASIPQQAGGTRVKYFIRVEDSKGLSTILANSSFLAPNDTTQGFFFYNVIDRKARPVLSISDIQTTPYSNGRSSLIGTVDSVGGIVTADTSSLRLSQISSFHTNPYYIQSGTAPFSGIWVTGPDSIMAKVANGDSIIVTGYINENFDVTRVENITKMRIVSRKNPLPQPLNLKTEVFGAGTLTGEPYEGMLVSFDNMVVTDIAPVFQDFTEFEASNSSKGIRIQLDGKHRVSITPGDSATGAFVVKADMNLGTVKGIIYYSAQRYKLVPRTSADFPNLVLGVHKTDDVMPKDFSIAQNYPNPFNPSTTIRFTVARTQFVTLKVYDLLGREVATMVNEQMNPGTYSMQWNAATLSSGVYFYRMQAGDFVRTMKLMLLK
ncbi:MAG TPA: T9SS type A sorting domain-containing protein [Bacteroidota bacterium]|nr:T9SS type A sorting domain-containing protein [Bacteroidota bacterium]